MRNEQFGKRRVLPVSRGDIVPYGNFTLAGQELKKASLKALFKLRREVGNHFSENIKLTIKRFDALISPITMYSSGALNVTANSIQTQKNLFKVKL